MFFLIGVFFAMFSSAMSLSPANWTGSFQDNVFGGSLNVCVSYDIASDTYYAQGVFSLLGYIRGTIDQSTNVWSGEYCLSGLESRSGTFSFSLTETVIDTGSILSYGGQFVERPGIPYMMYGNQTSAAMVSGLDCMEADTATMVAQATTPYSYTGEWYVVDANFSALTDPAPRWIYQDNSGSSTAFNTFTQSYHYGPEGAYQGYTTGSTCMNGQVAMINWYENGNYEGLYLFVAKNATFLMSSWLETPTVSNFQFSSTGQGSYSGASYSIKATDTTSMDQASIYSCYQLTDTADEEACYAAVSVMPTVSPTAAPNSNASNNYTNRMLKAILICAVFTLLAVIVFFGYSVLNSFKKTDSEARLLALHALNSSSTETGGTPGEKAGHNEL